MTYPPQIYHGDEGECSAVFRPDGTEPELVYRKSGTRVHYLSSGASTGGLFGLYRWECGPEVSGPDPHFHRTITESFYILSGTMRIFDGRKWLECEPGDYVHVPAGGIHGFKSVSGVPASMLLHFSPGAPREGYFEGLDRIASMSGAEREAFYLEHDNHWL